MRRFREGWSPIGLGNLAWRRVGVHWGCCLVFAGGAVATFTAVTAVAVAGAALAALLDDCVAEPMARVALAWVLHKSEVTAPIVGATQLGQLDDAVAALSVTLSGSEIKTLEAPYVPHAVVGHA